MKHYQHTDHFRDGYDSSMHVDDVAYTTNYGYVPLLKPGGTPPPPMFPRPNLAEAAIRLELMTTGLEKCSKELESVVKKIEQNIEDRKKLA